MAATIFDGKARAQELEHALIPRIQEIKEHIHRPPTLLSILVGDDPASKTFLDIKERRAHAVGIGFIRKHYPDAFDPKRVISFIHEANDNKGIDGIIVQLPVPAQFDRAKLLRTIDPFKDVDGLHPKNMGLLIEGSPTFLPPAVRAVIEVLDFNNIHIKGKQVVMVGSGLLIGKPVGLWLLSKGATVTYCHKETKNLDSIAHSADIIIVATGEAGVVADTMVSTDTVVIDFGGTIVDGRLKGDVEAAVARKASVFTPVPGGVGPLTVSFLLENTVDAAERFANV